MPKHLVGCISAEKHTILAVKISTKCSFCRRDDAATLISNIEVGGKGAPF